VRIASYNIRKGGSRRRHAIAEVLTALDADVAVLQEATNPEVVTWLAAAAGYGFQASRPGHSVALLGRREPADVRWHVIGPGRTFIEVALPHAVRLFGIHLSAGLSRRGERRRQREIEAILRVAGEERRRRRTMIVGDFNAIAPGDAPAVAALPRWIRVMLSLDGGIRTEVMTGVIEAGFSDAYRRLNARDGATLPSVAPVIRLDYAMVGCDIEDAVVACSVGDGAGAGTATTLALASDHLPLLTVLELAPSAGT
jgi:endonuclease/exonuclease/phosphatase family metal-dependent hydrolase